MPANFLHFFVPRVSFFKDDDLPAKHRPAVSSVHPERHTQFWIIVGWVLIALKCVAIWWACNTYSVPIHPLWLIVPTVLFGLLATVVYVWRD